MVIKRGKSAVKSLPADMAAIACSAKEKREAQIYATPTVGSDVCSELSDDESGRDEEDTSSSAAVIWVILQHLAKHGEWIPECLSVDSLRRARHDDTDEGDEAERHRDGYDLGDNCIAWLVCETTEVGCIANESCKVGNA